MGENKIDKRLSLHLKTNTNSNKQKICTKNRSDAPCLEPLEGPATTFRFKFYLESEPI